MIAVAVHTTCSDPWQVMVGAQAAPDDLAAAVDQALRVGMGVEITAQVPAASEADLLPAMRTVQAYAEGKGWACEWSIHLTQPVVWARFFT